MVPKHLRFAVRMNQEVVSDEPLLQAEEIYADINLLAFTIAGGRFPTSGEYLTAVARLYGQCSNLRTALHQVLTNDSLTSEKERITHCLELVLTSGLPLALIHELEGGLTAADELRTQTIQQRILSSCLNFVEDFELHTIGLKTYPESSIHTWAEILQRSIREPNLMIQTPTEMRLRNIVEIIGRFLRDEVTPNDPSRPEIIIDHEDLSSFHTREAYHRFLEQIDLDPCKVPTLTLMQERPNTEELMASVLCQIYPRTSYSIYATINLRRPSASIRFTRDGIDEIVNRLYAEKYVRTSYEMPATIAQALRVATEIRLHRDLRRCMNETFGNKAL